MSDLISRYIDVSEDAIKSILKKLNHRNIYPKSTDEMILRNYLDEFPTADVAPVVHGKWEQSKIIEEVYNCSVCGGSCWYYVVDGYLGRSKYCPNCGARMDGAI